VLTGQIEEIDERRKVVAIPAIILDRNRKFEAADERIMRSGQARTIAFPVPDLDSGRYLVDLEVEYDGMLLKEGRFERSSDEPLFAHEQYIGEVPSLPRQSVT
jgi:hypothetical protein